MAAVAVAGRVGVVLEQVDRAAYALFAQALLGRLEKTLEDPLTCLVVHHQFIDAVALGGGVLGMGTNVEVEARPVLQEHIAAASPADHTTKEVTRHLVGTQASLAAQSAGDAVLVLEPVDAPLHARTVAHLLDERCSTSPGSIRPVYLARFTSRRRRRGAQPAIAAATTSSGRRRKQRRPFFRDSTATSRSSATRVRSGPARAAAASLTAASSVWSSL